MILYAWENIFEHITKNIYKVSLFLHFFETTTRYKINAARTINFWRLQEKKYSILSGVRRPCSAHRNNETIIYIIL